jgi:putative endonuclease
LPRRTSRVQVSSPAPAFAERSEAKLERPPKRFGEGGLTTRSATAGEPFTFATLSSDYSFLAMHYAYILKSESHPAQRYIGSTSDLKGRLKLHNSGNSAHTSKFPPWLLDAYFAFSDKQRAAAFERYLKSRSGKAFMKRHLL